MEKPAVGSVGSGVSVSFDHGVRAALWEGEGGGTVSPGDPQKLGFQLQRRNVVV